MRDVLLSRVRKASGVRSILPPSVLSPPTVRRFDPEAVVNVPFWKEEPLSSKVADGPMSRVPAETLVPLSRTVDPVWHENATVDGAIRAGVEEGRCGRIEREGGTRIIGFDDALIGENQLVGAELPRATNDVIDIGQMVGAHAAVNAIGGVAGEGDEPAAGKGHGRG